MDDQVIGKIGPGLVVLLGIKHEDGPAEAEYIVNKVVNLRIFGDDEGKMNLSALDVNAELLVISQFTLYGDTRRGRRPSFTEAARPEHSEPLYHEMLTLFRNTGLTVREGSFGAHMLVEIHNNGPVTLMIDSDDK